MPTTRRPLAARRTTARVYWFSIEHSVDQGAWVENDTLVYRPAKDAPIEQVMPLSGVPLKGEHNVENVSGRRIAARQAGAAAEAVRRGVEDFQAVEHRLEYVDTVNGVEFYNDSKATNVDATAKAIAAFSIRYSPDPWRQRQGLALYEFSMSY